MIKNIGVKNFKPFSKLERLPICPLTLIYGHNNAGKSSILQSILLAHHAVITGELDVRFPILGKDKIDLGGFNKYVHNGETDRKVSWVIDIATESFKDVRIIFEFCFTNGNRSISYSIVVDYDRVISLIGDENNMFSIIQLSPKIGGRKFHKDVVEKISKNVKATGNSLLPDKLEDLSSGKNSKSYSDLKEKISKLLNEVKETVEMDFKKLMYIDKFRSSCKMNNGTKQWFTKQKVNIDYVDSNSGISNVISILEDVMSVNYPHLKEGASSFSFS